MTTKQAHTPTPWQVNLTSPNAGTFKLTDADGEFISYLARSRYHDDREDPEAEADAAHIVHCVNTHDALVAALRSLHDAWGADSKTVSKALVEARAALAAAEGDK